MGRIPQQLRFVFKPRDGTGEEGVDWYETELKWWGEKQFKIIIIATIVQISALGFMAAIMLLNGVLFK